MSKVVLNKNTCISSAINGARDTWDGWTLNPPVRFKGEVIPFEEFMKVAKELVTKKFSMDNGLASIEKMTQLYPESGIIESSMGMGTDAHFQIVEVVRLDLIRKESKTHYTSEKGYRKTSSHSWMETKSTVDFVSIQLDQEDPEISQWMADEGVKEKHQAAKEAVRSELLRKRNFDSTDAVSRKELMEEFNIAEGETWKSPFEKEKEAIPFATYEHDDLDKVIERCNKEVEVANSPFGLLAGLLKK